MSKKFTNNIKVWTYIIRYFYKNGKLDAGREWFKSGMHALGSANRKSASDTMVQVKKEVKLFRVLLFNSSNWAYLKCSSTWI